MPGVSRRARASVKGETVHSSPPGEDSSNPLSSPAVRLACTCVAGVTAFVLYVSTLAPTVTLVDSGELIVAAASLGVAHPPGFPLYVLLAHAATLLPFGNVALRVNAASALFAALAVAALAAVAAEALQTGAPGATAPGRAGVREGRNAGVLESAVAGVPVLVAALLLAGSRTLWSYATIAEVYTLNTLLILIVLFLMFRWRRRSLALRQARPEAPPAPADRWLYAAACVFGLALGVHHVTVGLLLPALAALVYATEGAQFFRSRRLLRAALWSFAGLSIYLYLPLAAARSPLLNWGDPRTLQRVWWHVTGRQYQAFVSFSPQIVGAQVQEFARLVGREFGPWWLPGGLALAVAGFVVLFRRDRALFSCLVLIIAAGLAYGLNYDIAEDKEAYYLPTFVVLAITVGFGARWLLARLGHGASAARRAAIAMALLSVPMLTLAANFRYNDRSRYFIAPDYVDNILSTIEPGGLLLTLDWQVCSPMLYARGLEARRRDVTLIDVNMLRRSWYFDYLRREYAEVMARAQAEVDAFLEDLRHWEQDPQAYERDVALNRRIDARFNAMILAFVSQHIGTAPVYVTQDIALNRDPREGDLTRALTTTYQLVPQGLVFQLFADRAMHEPAQPQWQTRGLADGSLQFEPDDVVRQKVFPVYVAMLYNRGRYLALHGRHAQAIAAFTQSLALDPSFVAAQRALTDSRHAAADAALPNSTP